MRAFLAEIRKKVIQILNFPHFRNNKINVRYFLFIFWKTAKKSACLHKIALTAQKLVAVKAGEMGHVPRAGFGLGAFVRENNLVTGGASRLEKLGMVAPTVNPCIGSIKKVDQIHEEFVTRVAPKTGRMPAGLGARTCRKYADGSIVHAFLALFARDLAYVSKRYLARYSPAQWLALPLLTEKFELVEFFVRQRVAVAGLVVVRGQLVEKLFYAVLFAVRVHVRDFFLWYWAEVLVYLSKWKKIYAWKL